MLDKGYIIGIGYDMVEVSRIESVLQRWGNKFEERVFTQRELKYCKNKRNCNQALACRFAAKEAVFKALGTGWQRGVGWRDVEVKNNSMGKPSIVLNGYTERLAGELGVSNIFVSMTNTENYGAAQVILTS
jgi:holo-[acyl-carrier protein] synthase